MIRSLNIKSPADQWVKWLKDVPALKEPRRFDFKPGLNILWGANGSGKSTVLKVLARAFHCEQGYVPRVTETSVSDLFEIVRFGKQEDNRRVIDSTIIDHDGQPVRFFDPSVQVGIIGGGFDFDFGEEGILNAVSKESAGQKTMRRFDGIVNQILSADVPEVKWNMRPGSVNELWGNRLRIVEEMLKGSGEKGPPTILLDEPERSFDYRHQLIIWRFIRSLATRVQFIVASHSFFALDLPEANYIEMTPDYMQMSRRVFEAMKGFSAEAIIPAETIPKPRKPSGKETPPKKSRSKG